MPNNKLIIVNQLDYQSNLDDFLVIKLSTSEKLISIHGAAQVILEFISNTPANRMKLISDISKKYNIDITEELEKIVDESIELLIKNKVISYV